MNGQQEIINFDYINTIGQNNNDFLLKMINTFLDQCPIILAELEEAVLSEDWEKTVNLAHRFVPSVGLMGMDDVAIDLKQLENNAKNRMHLDQSMDLFLPIKQTCIQAIEELETKKKLFLI